MIVSKNFDLQGTCGEYNCLSVKELQAFSLSFFQAIFSKPGKFSVVTGQHYFFPNFLKTIQIIQRDLLLLIHTFQVCGGRDIFGSYTTFDMSSILYTFQCVHDGNMFFENGARILRINCLSKKIHPKPLSRLRSINFHLFFFIIGLRKLRNPAKGAHEL